MGYGSGITISCGVGHRSSLDPTFLWLWCRPGAIAPIQSLAWELTYAKAAAVKRQKKKKRVYEGFIFSTSSTFIMSCLLNNRLLTGVKWYLIWSLIIINDIGHLFIELLWKKMSIWWFIFVFIVKILGSGSNKMFLWFMSKNVLPMFSCRSFIVSELTLGL